MERMKNNMFTLKNLIDTNKGLHLESYGQTKNYASVAERVKAFRRICLTGSIETDCVKADGDIAIFRATVKDDAGNVISTGTAYENRNNKGSYVNARNHLENAETSAVGRALKHAGISLALGSGEGFSDDDTDPETLEKNYALANKAVHPIKIGDKKYVGVEERITAFRKVYPDGAIVTELIDLSPEAATFKATIITDGGTVLGTGTACDKKAEKGVNSENYIENAETSAIGRALAFCGIGVEADIASADEIPEDRLVTEDEVKKLLSIAERKGVNNAETQFCERSGVTALSQLPLSKYFALLRILDKQPDKTPSGENAVSSDALISALDKKKGA